jgi:hypothetical protein
MPLRRTYASALLSLDSLSEPTENVHHTTTQPLALSTAPSVPSPTPMTLALQPMKKLPATSFRRSYLHTLPRRSSLLGPRQSSEASDSLLLRWSLHHWSLHPDRQIVPPFKPGRNLYRKVLKREFSRATKKATMNDMKAVTIDDRTANFTTDSDLTANVTTDDQ